MKKQHRHVLILTAQILFFLLLALLATGTGEYRIPFSRLLHLRDIPPELSYVLFGLRLPRFLCAFFAGAALGSCGAVYQGLFRNPLADPYILGSSSGAALGASLALIFFPAMLVPFSFAGSVATVFFVFQLTAGMTKVRHSIAILLAGTAVSAFCGALMTLLMAIHSADLYRIFFWTLGSFNTSKWKDLAILLMVFAPALTGFLLSARKLDILGLGDETARSMGIDTRIFSIRILLLAGLASAAAVSSFGIIGFVGLMAPHISRLVFGASHRRLILQSALNGGLLLAASDNIARNLLSPMELPVGVITAFIGAPFFLYLLLGSEWRKTHG